MLEPSKSAASTNTKSSILPAELVSVKSWLILALLALIWGSSFILMKRGLDVYTSNQVASLRIFIAAISLFPFVFMHFKKIAKEDYIYIFLVGLLGNCIPAFLFTKAETQITSSLAGVLNALTPLFTVLVGITLFKARVKWYNLIGIAIGFLGAFCLLVLKDTGAASSSNFSYGGLILIATLCYAFSVNIIRNKLHHIKSLQIAGWALFSVGIICGVYLFSTDFTNRLTTIPGAYISLGYVLILAVVGTAISLVIFNRLIKESGALFAASVTYFIPIVALLWGLFDKEDLGWSDLIGLGAILTGVYLVNKKAK